MSKLKPLRLRCKECGKDKKRDELKLFRQPNFGHHYYICREHLSTSINLKGDNVS